MSQSASATPHSPKIIISSEPPEAVTDVTVLDEYGEPLQKQVACERPLTLYLNWREIVTLMTLGTQPAELALGYLKNQYLLQDLSKLDSVLIDWETGTAAVNSRESDDGLESKLGKKTVTSGCGQGTMFGDVMQHLKDYRVPQYPLRQSELYQVLEALTHHNTVYKAAGGVHGCAICSHSEVLAFAEDVGRHNAVDILSGRLWLQGESGDDKLFFTTGRLTSEMVIKVAQMGIPVLISRSGVTRMGLSLAEQFGITLIARARGLRFQLYTGQQNLIFDVKKAEVKQAGVKPSAAKKTDEHKADVKK